jgi:hypothetical protein
MNRRDIVIGIIILAILAGVIYWFRRPQEPSIELPEQTTEEKIEEKFKTQIPEGVEKADLTDVSGGNATGLAYRQIVNGVFSLSILADLPDPPSGEFYQGWLVKTNGEEVMFSLGKFRIAKGGFLLDFSSATDYSDYKTVVVSQEKVFDNNLETRILEGSF